MPQLERQSAQLVELIEDLGDIVTAAMADEHIDSDESADIHLQFEQVRQFAMDHDEASAIGIAIIRTGVVSQRSQRLLRQREDRMQHEGRHTYDAAVA